MNLEINIKDDQIKIFLKNESGILKETSFFEKRNLAEKLLLLVDQFLKENKLRAKDIEYVKLKADMDNYHTTNRIAKAMADSFNWATKRRKNVDNL